MFGAPNGKRPKTLAASSGAWGSAVNQVRRDQSFARYLPTWRPNVTVRPQAMPVERFG